MKIRPINLNILEHYVGQIIETSTITRDEIFNIKSKKQPLAATRQILFHVLYKNGFNKSQIAKIFNLHHTTIIHGLESAEYGIRYKHKYYMIFYKLIPFEPLTYICPTCGTIHRNKKTI